MEWDALVLAGGGAARIARETGVLLGLTEGSPSIARHLAAERTRSIGTAAGSTVAAQLACGATLQDLFDAQIAGTAKEIRVSLDIQAFGSMMADAIAGATSPEETRTRIGVAPCPRSGRPSRSAAPSTWTEASGAWRTPTSPPALHGS
ncbi:hypothetical protein [uncultured Amnibacterium sp.]|uniref:hypothetical protein n=1 Tax=uncultured Amnibacterium sp. TaxID=1631851 RepID=UPI0035CAE2E9